jgi:uncharacterized protein (DUF58 family)
MRALYLTNRLFIGVGILVVLFIGVFFLPPWTLIIPEVLFLAFLLLLVLDIILLYHLREGVLAKRETPERLSNGDDNKIQILVTSFYPIRVGINVIDEIPHQFQKRDVNFELNLAPKENKVIQYTLRPVKRGEYSFGTVNVFVRTTLGLVRRRYKFSGDAMVPVYPSYLQMRKYELLAISNHLVNSGIKKIRRVGNNREFELIKEYVSGDDFRIINWKATARKSHLMVNQYQDEKSQQVYCLIDKGRVMQMPFHGMSLLDYAINASLVISNIAIKKSDKAGIITFQNKVNAILPASKQNDQMWRIQELLYKQKTAYKESDYNDLYVNIKHKVRQRSLLLLFTNFESPFSLERQLPYFRSLAKTHLLVVIFFENSEIKKFSQEKSENIIDIYHKTIAEQYVLDKKLIVKELSKHGIQSLLTEPELLTVNTINKYIELKARGLI